MNAYLHMTYSPTEQAEPNSHVSPYDGSRMGIPVLVLSERYGRQNVELNFGTTDDELRNAVRYLRQLVDEASKLCDGIAASGVMDEAGPR